MPKTVDEQASRAERWHQSGVEQMLGCPRSWFLEHVLGLDVPGKANTVAGTAYHAGVEWLERGRLLGEPRDREGMRDAAHACLQDELASVPVEHVAAVTARASKDEDVTGVAALEHQLDAALDAFWDVPLASGLTIFETLQRMEPIALEAYLSADLFPPYRTLAGTIDGIYWDVDARRVVLVDHKTSARVTDWKPGKGTEQAAHYSALARDAIDLELLDPRLPTRSYLPPVLFLVSSRVKPLRSARRVADLLVPVSQFDVDMLAQRIEAVERYLAQDRFPADPSYRFCGTCSFASRCVHGSRELMASAASLRAA